MKKDPYNIHERYTQWEESAKETGIQGISKYNSDLIMKYLEDMKHGINISQANVKGSRSFIRLDTIRKNGTKISLILFSRNQNTQLL
ncbi:MAG: hypothetical protein AABW51_01975 [Nanoarchaeota archaeon]